MAYKRLNEKKYHQEPGPSQGYVDVPFIDSLGYTFNYMCGARQIGKTWGVLELLLEQNIRFIYMRRTKGELEFSLTDTSSPFKKHPKYPMGYKRDSGNHSVTIYKIDGDDKTPIGKGMSLQDVAFIRGFDGEEYTDLIYDEFIPEQHVRRMRHEGTAVLNAYITINSTRELRGKKPLRVWFLSNSNSIISPVFDAYNLSSVVESTVNKGLDNWLNRKRRTAIFLYDDSPISKKLSETALFDAIGTNNSFAGMALRNEFAYDDFSLVGNRKLKNYKPLVQIGAMVFYESRAGNDLYCFESSDNVKMCPTYYTISKKDEKAFARDWNWLYWKYLDGAITFSSIVIKNKFLQYFE